MTEKTAYEHGARELKPLKGPDPHDDFSQEAAENKKPPLGMGISEKINERSEHEKSDLTDGKGGSQKVIPRSGPRSGMPVEAMMACRAPTHASSPANDKEERP